MFIYTYSVPNYLVIARNQSKEKKWNVDWVLDNIKASVVLNVVISV